MYTFHEALRQLLLTSVPLSALVDTEIYLLTIPADASWPRIRYQRVSGRPTQHLGAAAGHVSANIQFDCFSNVSQTEAENVANALRNFIDGRGVCEITDPSDASKFKFCSFLRTDDLDDMPPPEDGTELGFFRVMESYNIAYRESVPTLT